MTIHFYTFFPQFCREPLNDAAWHPGFTDWDLIRALPENLRTRFSPRSGFYDLATEVDIEREIDSIRAVPNAGMALYHYYFDGRFVLDSVERFLLRGTEPTPPFFLIWANETWTKRWVGKPGEVIIRQGHSVDAATIGRHVERLAQLMKLPSYFRLNGRPLFYIYAPYEISNVPELLESYRRGFSTHGLDPHIGFCVSYADPNFAATGFDSCVEFQPRLFFNAVRSQRNSNLASLALAIKRRLPRLYEWLTALSDRTLYTLHPDAQKQFPYARFLELADSDLFRDLLHETYKIPSFRGIFYSWNNFPRYGKRAVRVEHHQGEYDKYLRLLAKWNDPWVLINSWNEWSEGAALEQGQMQIEDFELVG